MKKRTTKLTQFVRGTFVLTLSNVLIKAANFFLLPLYTKYLPPDQLGISDSIVSLMSIVFPILVTGFDSAFSAFYYEKEGEEFKKAVFNTTFWYLVVMSILLLVPILFAGPISVLLFGKASYTLAIRIAMVSVAVNMWFLPFSLLMRIENRMTIFSAINFFSSLLMILMNIYMVTILGIGYMALIISNFLVHVIQLILYAAFTNMKLAVNYWDGELFKRMLRYALPMLPMIVSNWMLSLSDRYVLLWTRGEYEVGIYSVAARFLNVLTVVTSAIFTAFVSFAFSTNKDEDAKRQYVFVLDAVHLFLIAICLGVSVLSTEILQLMVNENYYTANVLIGPLLLGQVCYSANTIIGYGFAYEKKSGFFLIPAFTGALLNLVLNLILIPVYGAQAASWTTFVGYLVMLIITIVLAQRVYYCKYHIGCLLVSVAMAGIAVGVTPNMGLGYKLVLLMVCFFVLVFMYRTVVQAVYSKIRSIVKGEERCAM